MPHTHPPAAAGRTIYGFEEQERTTGEILRKQGGWGGFGGGAVRVSFSRFYQGKHGNLENRGHMRLVCCLGQNETQMVCAGTCRHTLIKSIRLLIFQESPR